MKNRLFPVLLFILTLSIPFITGCIEEKLKLEELTDNSEQEIQLDQPSLLPD